MNHTRRLFTPCLLLATLAFVPAFAQDDEVAERPYTLLNAQNGVFVVWNEAPAFLTLELQGLNIRSSIHGDCGLWVAESFYDLSLDDPSDFGAGELSGGELLRAHMRHEAEFWTQEAGVEMPLTERTVGDPLPEGMALWEIEWPKKARKSLKDERHLASDMERNLFLTVAVAGRVFVVSRPLLKNENPEEAYAYLTDIAESVRISDKPLNIGRVQRELLGR